MKNSRVYTVSDAVLDTLKAHGISHIFGYPGGAILPFYDALPYHHDIKHILVRHEQGAAFMAQGWARSTRNIGVCCSTSGPGATNLITGIADAYMDSIPILCITGQVPLPMIGKDMFQETDMTGVTMSITKHNYLVENPDEIVYIITEAIKISLSGRPGPVHVDIPKDILASEYKKKFKIPHVDYSNRDPMHKAYQELPNHLIDNLIKVLQKSKKPILLLGHGIKHAVAEDLARKLVNKLGIPTVTTILAKGVINPDNPNYLGMLGMHGFYHSNMATHEADLIFNIGSRFDDRIVGRYDSFGKKSTIIHVDIDRAELNKVVKADIAIHSDANLFLKKLLAHPKITKLKLTNWWQKINKWKNNFPYQRETKHFTMRTCLRLIQKIIERHPSRYIIVTDVGQHQMWAMLSNNIPSSTQWLSSGGAGSMGFAFPAAIGAAFANPKKTLICLTGDGGFQMNLQELGVLAQHNLNLKVIILNNNYLGMVRQWQNLFYQNNYSEVLITNPDYQKLADAYGIKGYMAKSESKLSPLLEKMFQDDHPCLIDCQVFKEDNVFPMVPGGKTLAETIVK